MIDLSLYDVIRDLYNLIAQAQEPLKLLHLYEWLYKNTRYFYYCMRTKSNRFNIPLDIRYILCLAI